MVESHGLAPPPVAPWVGDDGWDAQRVVPRKEVGCVVVTRVNHHGFTAPCPALGPGQSETLEITGRGKQDSGGIRYGGHCAVRTKHIMFSTHSLSWSRRSWPFPPRLILEVTCRWGGIVRQSVEAQRRIDPIGELCVELATVAFGGREIKTRGVGSARWPRRQPIGPRTRSRDIRTIGAHSEPAAMAAEGPDETTPTCKLFG